MISAARSTCAIPQAKAEPMRFGCRLFAYMTPKMHVGEDSFIRQCLVDGDNSLRAQCVPEPSDPGQHLGEQITSDGRQDDGWGVAFFGNGGPVIRKAPSQALDDPEYLTAVQEAAHAQPGTLLAHLREGLRPGQVNTHPFQFGPWAFMHNGTVSPNTLAGVKRNVVAFHKKYGTPRPKGTTDTEQVFSYLLGRMQEKCGAESPEQIRLATEPLFETFRETMGELARNTRQEVKWRNSFLGRIVSRFKRLLGLEKKSNVKPGLNFILSDGERILASCHGRKLFLGLHKGTDGTPEVMLASRIIQPSRESSQPAIVWYQVPEDSVLLMARKPDGIELRQETL